MSGRDKKVPCGQCEKTINKNDDALQCDLCNLWFHIICEKVNQQLYNVLAANPPDAAFWYCQRCKKAVLPMYKKIAALQLQQEDMDKRLSDLEGRSINKDEAKEIFLEEIDSDQIQQKILTSLNDKLQVITEKTEDQLNKTMATFDHEINSNINRRLNKVENDLSMKLEDSVHKKLVEFQSDFDLIERNKDNIVIHRLSEENGVDNDKDNVLEILKVVWPNTTEVDIKKISRIGLPENSPRPVIIKLPANIKQHIMENLSKLKNSPYNISITHDLPRNTRLQRKKLLNECRATKAPRADDFLYKFVGRLGMERVKAIPKQQH